ncbi:MAG: helix-turn-helix transcriptional regulator [Bacilli bacterium]|nr:helix-turn-helix transcriptional regulator [Bacilli bacterium]MBN2696497.1 helix-turn-helix transcriptional regulator [Bacilli bacterium]
MIKRLENDLQRRKLEMYQFYYQSIGISIKQRRLELKMTQEALAKGICSNTYISKIENNAIAVNRENLYLIMERMDMPIESIGFPEEMVDILESSFDLFVRKDFEGYERLFQNISKYQFGILIQIARFGYYVLIGDTDAARGHYNELFRYLSSLKEYGLSVFAIYACWYNIQINEYQKAKEILERIENLHHYSEDINALLFELQFVIYGHLHLFSIARSGFEIASTLFIQKKNLARIVEMIVYQNIYNIFNRSLASIDYNVDQIKYLSGKQKNQYLWMIAHAIECPESLEAAFDLKEPHYLDYLYQLALSYRSRKMDEEYRETKKKLAMLHYELHAPVDYSQILELSETGDELEYKDFLASLLLPYYYSIENIYLAGLVTEEISELLKRHSRYKDSGIYRERYQKFVEKLQKTKRAK